MLFFYGTLRTSQNKQFCVVFRDGYGDSKKWINGKVVLIEKDDLLWIKEFERPSNGAVSDNGRIVLVHTINRDYSRLSSPKEFIELGSKLTVIERSGEEIFAYDFGSNVEPCLISSDGNLVSVATAMPDNSVYCFDPQQKRMLWKYKNHNKIGGVSGLKFNGNEIDVFAGVSMATKEKQYALKLDGTLSQEYEKELQTLKKIKKLVPRERESSLF
jgi:outer membrane protein assembly factor BamB